MYRERERDRYTYIDTYICTYIHKPCIERERDTDICIYIHTYILTSISPIYRNEIQIDAYRYIYIYLHP